MSKLTLNAAIASAPRSLFGDKDKGTPPKFRKIFAHVVKAMLKDAGQKFDEKTVDLVAEAVNPSSFQRQVADHRATITGLLKGGKYQPIPEKAPKKERGKPRPSKDEDDLGLGSSKKSAKKPLELPGKGKNAPKKARTISPKEAKRAEKLDKKVQKALEKPAKPPEKPAKADNAKKAAKTGLEAIAAARAALAKAKALKAAKAKKAPAKTEETVEI